MEIIKDNKLVNNAMGKALREIRLSNGLTQTKVAKSINVTFQQVQKYEKGTNGLSLEKFFLYCMLYEMTPNQLFKQAGMYVVGMPKITEIEIKEVKNYLTTRLDAKYWLKKKEEDEQKKD